MIVPETLIGLVPYAFAPSNTPGPNNKRPLVSGVDFGAAHSRRQHRFARLRTHRIWLALA